MKVVTVVGARPQFIKAAVLSPHLRRMAREVLVHTGQHHDPGLSQIFFRELALPTPDYALDVGSDTSGAQTGDMLRALDHVLGEECPDWVLVYGDTNSTLAGALAAAKLHIPVVHVEAGLRSYRRSMPEEINRVLTDHLSTRLYCPNAEASENLAREGIHAGVRVVGDVMEDAIRAIRTDDTVRKANGWSGGGFYLLTVHRQENTDRRERLEAILTMAGALDAPVVFPVHPRTGERMRRFGLVPLLSRGRICAVDPVGYAAMLDLEQAARAVLTDSGGVQREAGMLGVPCYVLREETEWNDLVKTGRAVLVGASDAARMTRTVLSGVAKGQPADPGESPAKRIAQDLAADPPQTA